MKRKGGEPSSCRCYRKTKRSPSWVYLSPSWEAQTHRAHGIGALWVPTEDETGDPGLPLQAGAAVTLSVDSAGQILGTNSTPLPPLLL